MRNKGRLCFSYRELVQLYEQETPPEALQTKLHRLLTMPFVSNSATARGVKPLVPKTPKLGGFLRVVEWNIERGLEYDAIRSAFTDPARFAKLIDSSAYPRGGLHGNAILSRFSLENVRLQPFEHQPHDWYKEELEGVKPLEEGKRKAGELVFQEKVRREVRRA